MLSKSHQLFNRVKLAFDKQTGKHVAVKIIKKIDRSNLKTLQNELNIMM